MKTDDLLTSVVEELFDTDKKVKQVKKVKTNLILKTAGDEALNVASVGTVYIAFATRFLESTQTDDLKQHLGIIGSYPYPTIFRFGQFLFRIKRARF